MPLVKKNQIRVSQHYRRPQGAGIGSKFGKKIKQY